MRRKDREITDKDKIKEIISACDCCRLGFNDNGKVYIVPLNFGFIEKNGEYTFYFHGAKTGRKHDIMKVNNCVGFELDTNHRVYGEGNIACTYTSTFQSVIGSGKVFPVEDLNEKVQGLFEIMKHNTGKSEWELNQKMVNAVHVFKLKVEELACKEHE